MSSSHAPSPSDSMFIPETSLVSPEIPAGQPEQNRARRPFNVKKILRTGGVAFLVVALAGAIVTIGVMANQLSTLTIRVNSLDAAFRSGQISQLASSVSAQDSRIRALETASEQHSAALAQEIKRLSGELADIKTVADNAASRAGALQLSLSAAEARLSTLESEQRKPAAAVAEQPGPDAGKSGVQARVEKAAPAARKPATHAQSASTKKTKRSARVAAPAAPFSLTGIERRGGHTFAVVIPSGASAISQMKLLSPGDASQGWVLRAINGSEAVFSFNGAERRLSVQ